MKKSIFSFLFCLCLILTGCQPVFSESADTSAQLLCLNIGKADCMLLLYGGDAYLIDTGYEQTWPALETALSQFGITRLNGVFLTHCHEDHQGGLMPLAKSNIAVDAWYASRIFYDQKESKHPAKLAAAERGQEVTWLDAGAVIPVGSDASLTVLGPLSVNMDNENNNSLVLRFDSPQSSILLAGDMKEEEEYELLDAGDHGDSKATSKAFLEAVRPKAAIILTSTAEEPDTPANSTVRQLDKIGCQVYVSQEFHDTALFTLSGGEVSVEDVTWQGVPARMENVRLSIDVQQDTVTIQNTGKDALALTGYMLYSTKGNDLLALPDVTLPSGGQYVIGSGETAAATDLTWRKKRVWNDSKFDMGILYDAFGRPIACADNGITE